MITNFNTYNLIIEKTGINTELKYLSEEILNLLKDNNKKHYVFDGSLFNINIMNIHKIIINITNRPSSSFEISKSKITPKGFIINLTLNKDDIKIEVIHHELEHALKYYMKKTKDIDTSAEDFDEVDISTEPADTQKIPLEELETKLARINKKINLNADFEDTTKQFIDLRRKYPYVMEEEPYRALWNGVALKWYRKLKEIEQSFNSDEEKSKWLNNIRNITGYKG